MRILLAGATGVIGRQTVPVLTAAGHQVTGLAARSAHLPDAEVLAADALDPAAVAGAVRSAGPDVIVHMLTAIPDPVDPRHLARDMALTNRLRTQGTANLLAATGGARMIAQGVAYAYDPAGPRSRTRTRPGGGTRRPSSPRWSTPPRSRSAGSPRPGAGAAAGPPVWAGLQLWRRRRPHPADPRRQAPTDRRRRLAVLVHPRPRRRHRDPGRRRAPGSQRGAQHRRRPAHPGPRLAARDGGHARRPAPGTFPPASPGCSSVAGAWPT